MSGGLRGCRGGAGILLLLMVSVNVCAQTRVQDLGDLSLEDLGQVIVSSVTKSPEALSDAPASVYVISHDDVIRSGATSVPEMLRLAPNLEVFQTSPATYVITARGFNGNPTTENLSNKLLVLIDGRSVYNPLFSGMYWEMQQVLPENIERIEVVSGPGATLWGANAMNGVINIVTRDSAQTQGGLLDVGVGNHYASAAVQYGGHINADTRYRAYATRLHERAFDGADGHSAEDGWWKTQAGFRLDWTPGRDSLSVQGAAFDGRQDQGSAPDQLISGGHLLTDWRRRFADGSSLQVVAYYDRVHRMAAPRLGGFTINTANLQLQHDITLGSHHVVWGAGARSNRFDIVNSVTAASSFMFVPSRFTSHVLDVFAQDQIALGKRLSLVLGLKLEDDPYSGWTPLPSVRAAWRLDHDATLWAAASHAIRSPTPLDTQLVQKVGTQDFLLGNRDFQAEKLTAFELGYRQQMTEHVSLSVSVFDHRYNNLRTIEPTPTTLLPLFFGNGMAGHVRGVEMWGSVQPADWWRLSAGLTLQREHLRFKPGASKLLGTWQAGNDPQHRAFIRSTMVLSTRWTLNADLRKVGPLPNPHVPGYVELNARLGWKVSDRLELSLAGFNLLHPAHQEYVFPGSDRSGRSVLLDTRLRF